MADGGYFGFIDATCVFFKYIFVYDNNKYMCQMKQLYHDLKWIPYRECT